MSNKIIRQLQNEHPIPTDIIQKYQFEIKGNKIFIMTNAVYKFLEIRPIRKGLLFAVIKGNKIQLTDNANYLINNIR
jgi:hypothetical protein